MAESNKGPVGTAVRQPVPRDANRPNAVTPLGEKRPMVMEYVFDKGLVPRRMRKVIQ